MGSPIELLLPQAPDGLDTPTAVELTKHDRCDHGSCGAQAFVRVMVVDLPLTFCGHHYSKVESSLAGTDGVVVHDFRDKINSSPSASSAAGGGG